MFEVILVAYIIVAVALIGFILIQQGKGADMGASFGSGSAGTVFGSSGAGNFLTKTTSILATVFFVLCLLLGGMAASKKDSAEQWQDIQAPVQEVTNDEVPVAADKAADEIPQ